MPDALDAYLRKLRDALKAGNATEHTHRPALKALVESVRSKTVATNEPSHVECGAPDFAVGRRTPAGLLTVGHIETKDVDAPLAQVEKSPQLKRYLRSLPNLILTDYLEFRWYVDGESRAAARLGRATGEGKIARDAAGAQAVLDLLNDFLAHSPEPITKPRELAERMARLTHIIRDIIVIAFQNHRASSTLTDLRTAFARTLIPDLDQPERTAQFADMYAQTIAYGLFAARCNHGPSGPFRRLGAAAEIPKTNPFLRQLFETITGSALNDEPYGSFVDDLAALLNNANIEEVLAEFGARTRREDPVVHFYETFLATYDPQVRERRGVYYTPEPVVSYIVRSVDHILRTRFGLPAGLADTGTVRLRNAAVPAAPASGDAGATRAADAAARASGDAGATRSAAVSAAGGGPAFRVRDRGYLPHWELEGSTYFITFRLGDSLPELVLAELRAEREAAQAALQAEGREITEADRRRLSYLFSQRVDQYLDAGTGACHLARPEIGKLMAEALRHFDGQRYRLFAWCVMPNHVHVVCDFLGGHGLEDVLHSWKSYVAHRANRLLGRKGTFWAREYHDHIVRDEKGFYRIVRYVAGNPEAAGLRDWPWVWACDDYRDVVPERNAAVSAAGASADAGATPAAAPAAGASGDAGVTRGAAVPAALASEDAGVTVPRVLILDPACGTGTFLYAVVDHIRERFIAAGNAGMWSGYVRNHLLPRLFGFELLMAPYAVAHLKLGMQLAALDLPPAQRATWAYDFAGDERLSIFLTNTLEQTEQVVQRQFHFVERIIAEEARGAARVKRDLPIMVVLGNPPYSGVSANMGDWIVGLLKGRLPSGEYVPSYYEVDGEPLGEKKVWLQDDYVKFMRWAQWRVTKTGAGVVALITNHGYLDNPTFRGMRRQLMKCFDEVYVIDLHGSAKKRESAPDGSPDENVFDIQQGVAIAILVKLPTPGDTTTIHHKELWAPRDRKYAWLLGHDVSTTDWTPLDPTSPFYFFVPREEMQRAEYEESAQVQEALPVNVTGIVTARDGLVIGFDDDEVVRRISAFLEPARSDEAVARHLGLRENYAWRVSEARSALRADLGSQADLIPLVRPLLYRPFDERRMLYHAAVVWRPRESVMCHLLAGANLALVTTRQTRDKWDALATTIMIGHKSCAAYDINSVFPLYLYPRHETGKPRQQKLVADSPWPHGPSGRVPNLDATFVGGFTERLGLAFVSDGVGDLAETFGPEDVFHYIYAVFHAPTYRERYAEFLKIDFPRVPLTSDLELFRALCGLGADLVALHLLESEYPHASWNRGTGTSRPQGSGGRGTRTSRLQCCPLAELITTYPVPGDNAVAKGHPRYLAPGDPEPGTLFPPAVSTSARTTARGARRGSISRACSRRYGGSTSAATRSARSG